MPWEGMLGKCWNGCAMCWLFVQGWARALCGQEMDARIGARKGCGRVPPQAATRGRTWAATRRRGHRETASATAMAGAGKP